MKLIPLTLYVHLPWCVKKCPYCDFNSHALKDTLPEKAYLEALKQDLDNDLSLFGLSQRSLTSIFFGGGTPSLFSPEGLGNFLNELQNNLLFNENIEITLEVNPGTIEHHNFLEYYQAGINRISLGIQSFQNDKLKVLGRIHNQQNIHDAIEKIQNAGFKNINFDLMYGLPNQTIRDAIYDLQSALQYSPTHLSWYHLTLEPNTLFFHQPPELPDENVIDSILDQGNALLSGSGFSHYEVSAFTREGFHSKHNVNYWQFGDYLGIGAGAHSKITHPENNIITRLAKLKHPKAYLSEHQYIDTKQVLHQEEIVFEFMLNALRLLDGFSIELFEERTRLPWSIVEPIVQYAYDQDLLAYIDQTVVPTKLGKAFLNDTISLFLPKNRPTSKTDKGY